MKEITKQKEILNTIYQCLKDYDLNLKNKNIMFIVEDKNKKILKEEVFFQNQVIII